MHAVLLSFAILGHAFLWVGLLNRLHSVGLRRRTIAVLTVGGVWCAALVRVATRSSLLP